MIKSGVYTENTANEPGWKGKPILGKTNEAKRRRKRILQSGGQSWSRYWTTILSDGNNWAHYVWDETTNQVLTLSRVFQLRDLIQNTPGNELIVASDNRDFSSDTSFYTKDAGVTISGNKLNYTSCPASRRLYRNGLIAAREVIRVQFDIDSITGLLQPALGGQLWDTKGTTGQYLLDLAVSTGSTRFQLSTSGTSTDAVVDNLSLKKILGNHLVEIAKPPTKEAAYISYNGADQYSKTAVGGATIGTIYIIGQRIGTDADFDVFNALTGFGEFSGGVLSIGANLTLSAYYNIRIKEILIRTTTDDASTISKINAGLKKNIV